MTDYSTMLPKLRSTLAQLGFLETVFYGLGRLVQKLTGATVIYRYALMAQPVPGRSILPPQRGINIHVRLLVEPDPVLSHLALSPEVTTYRFRQGAVCLVAFKNGDIIGCLWLCLGPYEEDEVRCTFVPLPLESTSWDFGIYLSPTQRGGFVFARLWDEANAYLRKRGISWSYSRVGTSNIASLASHRRLGAQQLGTATFVCLGRWQLMLASLRPFVHLSLSPDVRPALYLKVRRAHGNEIMNDRRSLRHSDSK